MDPFEEYLDLLARIDELDDTERQRLNELQDSLDVEELDREQIDQLEAALVAAFDEADEADDLDSMAALAEEIEGVRNRREALEEEEAARQAQADDLRDRVRGQDGDEDDDPDTEGDEEDEDDEGDTPPPAEADADEGDEEDDDDQPSADSSERIAADGRAQRRRLGDLNRRRRQPRDEDAPQIGLSIVASAEVPGHQAGSEITFEDVGVGMAQRLDAVVKAGKAAKGRYPVATFRLEYPEERMLGRDPVENEERIEDVVGPEALTAAGGLCAPVGVSYDLQRIDSDERPLRDSLPRFGAERGGIRFLSPPSLEDVDDGVSVWTEATDSDPGESTKPFTTIVCGEETEVLVDAIVKRARVGNFLRRTFPEQWDAWWGTMSSVHARLAENRLWDNMRASALAVTHAEQLGVSRDLLTALDQALAAYRFRHRQARGSVLRVVLPDYVRDMIRADLTQQLPGDETMAVSDAQIDEWFGRRNAEVVWTLDAGSNNTFGAQGAGALIEFPATIEALIYHEGAYLYVDGGELDLGVNISSPELTDTNDVEAFMETFENVAFRGHQALALTLDVCPNGKSVGTVAATACGS